MGQWPAKGGPSSFLPTLLILSPLVWVQALDKLQEAKAEDIQVTYDLNLWWALRQCPVLFGMPEQTQLPFSSGHLGGLLLPSVLKLLEGPDWEPKPCSELPLLLPPTKQGLGQHDQARGTEKRGEAGLLDS